MSADFEAVRLALRVRLQAMSGYVGDTKVHFENLNFVPPTDGSLWLRENLVTGEEKLTSTRFQECIGLYYLYVNMQTGRGTKLAHDMAKSICDVYPPGTSIAGLGINLYRTTRLQARFENVQGQPIWFSVPVVIYWRVFAPVPAGA